eukprot:Plantae.Rhodophyta-Hildenbrandia_rubra.ctg3861.p1 GENE.Plantae.Rhodophyta-Hildenbrandia_rubra.ctg3861~~Plantae.Rhodophyta-Hildenbrandia_rubra.ctg3861.p1  ORF type:complete len:252 (-),score=11.04 Plantae.Rhodophyta-Hildenbrandia_rubra.ctg3861:554-1309(-)
MSPYTAKSYPDLIPRVKPTSTRNLFTFTPLPEVVQRHLTQVYLHLFLLTLFATLGAYIQLTLNYTLPTILSILITLPLIFYFSTLPSHPHLYQKRRNLLCAIATFQGYLLGPLISLALDIGGSKMVMAAVGATSGIFGGLAISSMMTKRRSWLYLNGVLSGSLSAMFWMWLLLPREWVFNVLVYGGLVTFCGFVLYDSQIIVEKAAEGDRDVLRHALLLFQDAVAIFRRVLIIMIKNKVAKKDKKRSKDDE